MTSAEYRWLAAPTVRVLHARLINDFGGVHGEGGPGDLDALLARARHRAAYEDLDIFDLAAAYADALVRGHALTDGNKRIGFTAALVFLAINDVQVPHLGQARATERTLALAAGAIGRAEYAHWLRGTG